MRQCTQAATNLDFFFPFFDERVFINKFNSRVVTYNTDYIVVSKISMDLIRWIFMFSPFYEALWQAYLFFQLRKQHLVSLFFNYDNGYPELHWKS